MLKRNKTKSLYDRALEKKNENLKKEELYKNLNLDKDKNTIIIENKSNFLLKILSFLMEVIEKIIKFIIVVIALVLLTIGATVILNPLLRNNLLEVINILT